MSTSARNAGVTADVLFVGATRPPMRWGVSYGALIANLVVTMEAFLLTRNLLTLLVCLPVHGACALLCARDPRFFDLLMLWGRTRIAACLTSLPLWHASSYSPLRLELPNRAGRRPRRPAEIPVASAGEGA